MATVVQQTPEDERDVARAIQDVRDYVVNAGKLDNIGPVEVLVNVAGLALAKSRRMEKRQRLLEQQFDHILIVGFLAVGLLCLRLTCGG